MFDADNSNVYPAAARTSLSRSRIALWAGVLPEVEAGVDGDLLPGEADRFGARRTIEQEGANIGDEVVVVRVGIRDARPGSDVGRDDGRVVLRGDDEIVGIREAADVVRDDRTRGARCVEHRGPPRVDRERHVEHGIGAR